MFALASQLRRLLYSRGLRRQHRFAVPIIVVGNISVGGTGKTPLVVYLARKLRAAGWRPGVVSRGYGGTNRGICAVQEDSDAGLVGDEALLIRRSAEVPVYVAPRRVSAVHALLEGEDCNVVLSDDGLQHYAMARDIEIAVVDARRGFGNRWLLPAGPLREPVSRLREVDLVVYHGGRGDNLSFDLRIRTAINLVSGADRPLASFTGQRVHAVAGIGDPDRFFNALRYAGLDCTRHPFADHHRFKPEDVDFGDDLNVLLTAKDAVKCEQFANSRLWWVPAEVEDHDGRIIAAVTGFLNSPE